MDGEHLPAQVDRAVAAASECYGDNTALRAAITAIPYIGGGLDLVLAAEGQRAFKERIEKLMSEIHFRMEVVEKGGINKDYLGSEEFIDLVMKALDATIKTRDEGKIRWYARILTESTMRIKQERYSPRNIFT